MASKPISQTGTPSSAALATTLVSSAAITGAAFGLGKASSKEGITGAGSTRTSRNPVASQRIVYGTRGQLGGTITYVTTSETTDTQHLLGADTSDNGNIHLVITMAGHQVTSFNGATVTTDGGGTASVPLVIYIDGYQVPLTVNGAPAFGGSGGSYISFAGLTISSSYAPADGAYYVPYDFVPPKINGKADKAHDFRNRIRVEISVGDPSSTSQPFPLLHSDTVSGNPGSWSSTCLQRGCAAAHVQLVWDATRFNNGLPNITFDISGKAVYDPRLSPPGFAYSENSALCLYDWLTDTKFGLGVDSSNIDMDLVVAAANVCDDAMVLREGGTQPRYTCNGVVEADQQRGQTAQKILDSMAGVLVPPSDKWKIYAGITSDSVLSLTDADLRGAIKIDTAVSRKDLANGAKGTYIAADNNWQAADYPPYVNATYVVDDGGTATLVDGHYVYTGVVFSDLALDFVSDPIQAQRLAKIKVEKIRRNNPLVLQCKMIAFPVEVNDVITFTHARFGLTSATYLVINTALVIDDKGEGPVLGYDLVCVPYSSDIYSWDADVDEGTVVIVSAPLLPDNTNVGAPTGVGSPAVLGLESDSSTTIVRADGIAHSQILVTWTPPTDAHVLNGGYIEIFIKKVSDPDTDWALAGTVPGNQSFFYIDNNISDGIDYDVMIQSLNAAGSHSEGLSGSVVCSGSASSISGGGAPGPIGLANNDFEASTAIPPATWVPVGSPTLDYEISSQQQGARSLKVTSSVNLEGVHSEQKVSVVPGDMFTGEQYKVGGYIKGDGTARGIIALRFFDAADAETGPAIIADGGDPTPADWTFYSATGLVPSDAVYAKVYLQNDTLTSPMTSTLLEFDSIVLFRVASLEDEIVNGPSRGAITAANTSYRPLSNPLTAHDDGLSGSPLVDTCEIDVASFTMRCSIGPVDISVNSGTLTGLLPQTTYHVYYDDPTYAGGAVTYFANTNQAVALDAEGRFYVGSILTPMQGGLDTIGNNDGGTGAQSGQLYWLSPTLRADVDTNNNQTWYPANEAETDGDTTIPYDLTTQNTVWLGGIPTIYSKWTNLKLKVHSEVDSVISGGAAFLDYSLDDGATWNNIYNVVYGSDFFSQPTTGASASGAGNAWVNAANICDPNNYATITGMAHGATSQLEQGVGYGFTIPSGATIQGLTISFDESDGGSAEPAETPTLVVQMLKAGVAAGTPKTISVVGSAIGGLGTLQLGNNLDLWGTTWTYSDVNDAGFGFQIKAVTPTALGAWVANTYYSPMAMIIDSNGNYQLLVTPGTSGGSHPTWSTTLSATTTDNTATWVLYQKTGLTWASGQAWTPGYSAYAPNASLPNGNINTPHFITATASGTSCVFELTAGRMPRLGDLNVWIWRVSNQGYFDKNYPIGTPSAPKEFLASGPSPIKSLHWFNSSPYSSGVGFHWYAINGDGTVGATTAMGEDSSSTTGGWEALVVGQMQFPAPGTYNFKLWHDDGMMLAFDNTKTTKLSGVYWNVNASQRSPYYGFPWMAGQNASTNYSGNGEVAYNGNPSYLSMTVNTPANYDGVSPIVVAFELAYMNWEHTGRMILTCQDSTGTYQELIPLTTALKTSTGTPTWPAWSTSLAPNFPSVTDAGGNYIWVNRGPATDFAWIASSSFTAAATTITGSNGYKETAYRAGKSGSSEPAWSSTPGAKIADGSSLTWRNLGGYTSSTSFDFGIKNAAIDVAYLPAGAVGTRNAATDEVSLPLTQNLGKVQVRYGLTAGGEMQVYEVWVEAVAG